MKRPMRPYRIDLPICPVCSKPIRNDEPIQLVDGAYRHAVRCDVPLRRRAKA